MLVTGVGCSLLFLGLWITVGNVVGVIAAYRRGTNFSMVPLFGGLLTSAGVVLVFGTDYAWVGGVCMLLDPGGLLLLVTHFFSAMRRRK